MKKIGKVALKISFVFYLLALVYLLFLGTRAIFWSDISWIEYIKNSSNFVPFKTITTYILAMFDGSMNMYIPIENLFGNFMMFMPMGIYLPYLFKHLNKFSRFTISMSSLLIVIEVVQV
ncbi:VanZ family protein, partial [Niallia circulans]